MGLRDFLENVATGGHVGRTKAYAKKHFGVETKGAAVFGPKSFGKDTGVPSAEKKLLTAPKIKDKKKKPTTTIKQTVKDRYKKIDEVTR